MISKRGQVTLFVIIAVILVAAILFFLVIRPQITRPAISAEEAQRLLASQVEPIKTYTENCMKTVARKTLNTMGRQGGYIIPKPDRFTIPADVIADSMVINYALFYDKGMNSYVNFLPSLDEICQSQLKEILSKDPTFPSCINDYEQWKKEYGIEIGNLNLSDIECKDIIAIRFSQPVKLSLGGSSTVIDDYVVTIPINMPKIRELASRVLNKAALGGSFAEAMVEEGDNQWTELKNNPDTSERVMMQTYTFREPSSSNSGVMYNELNTLFRIEYSNKALDKPFDFYFLAGYK
jgi:hypothetical protein